VKQTISILGASGFIGRAIYKYFTEELLSAYTVHGTYFEHRNSEKLAYLDVRDRSSVEEYLLKHRPKFLIVLTGSKDTKRCEEDYAYAYSRNTKPIEDICYVIKRYRLDTRVIFFSTDYVFDGQSGCYSANALPNPSTSYGKSNAIAEHILEQSGADYKIIRASAVMGRGGVFFDWLINAIKNEKEVALFGDIIFTPTPIPLVTKITAEIIRGYETVDSKIHLVGEKHISRYEFGKLVAGLIKGHKANLISGLAPPLYPKKLTLLQSDIVKKHQIITLEEFLADEVGYD
jgi:dTDP-4-dehydrorhamnose reductase